MNGKNMEAQGKPPFRRRKFLIHKPAQIRLVITLCLAVLAVNATSSVALYRYLKQTLEDLMFSSHIQFKNLSDVVMPVIARVNSYAVVAILILSAVIIAVVVYKMNKALRFVKNDIHRISELDFTGVGNYKRGESIAHMMEAFDEMTLALSEKLTDIVSCSRRISELTDKEGEPDTAQIKKEIEKLKGAISQFD